MSIYLKANVLEMLSPFTSKEETRYYLQGVYVDKENNSYVATDGNAMGVYEDDSAGECPRPLIIPATKELSAALRAARKQWLRVSVNNFWLVLPDDAAPGKSSIAYIVPDKEHTLEGVPVLSVTPIDGSFPDWLRVVPADIPSPAERGTISADMDLCAKFALGENSAAVAFFATGCDEKGNADRPMLVLNAKHHRFFGVLMPMRNESESDLLERAPLALRRRLGLEAAPAIAAAA